MFFLSWLYLICGVSHENCRIARDYLVIIARMASQAQFDENVDEELLRDVRSITKRLDLNPNLEFYVCCPTCYSLYNIEVSPDECGYQELLTTKVCNTELFSAQNIGSYPLTTHVSTQRLQYPRQKRQKIPRSTFVVQDFKTWITWFLYSNDVESAIDEWTANLQAIPEGQVTDYLQSPAYARLYPRTSTVNSKSKTPPPLNLAFSLFVDWYNPLGNKIAGKQLSIGVLALNCLNLPPHLRNLVQHTFLSGVVPAPDQPDMVTIGHILRPLVDELLQLNNGFVTKTCHYPKGRRVFVRLAFLRGDIVATHKVAGFTSHSGRKFCTWCEITKDAISSMTIGNLRTRQNVLHALESWKESRTLTARESLRKKTGIRWSELNRLPYWDPVMSVGLGVMHNWLEGVLQHHFRYRWVYLVEKESKGDKTSSDEDELMSGDKDGLGSGWLSDHKIQKIAKNLRSVIVPMGTTPVPKGLGTKKNGKLKASKWQTLFTIYLPLAAVNVFIGEYETFATGNVQSQISNTILLNFCALVECTHIVGLRTITKNDAQRFSLAYKEYTRTSEELQAGIKVLPNHHYSLHIPRHMLWFGPLSNISEFSGEQMIGTLQKMHTNGKMGECR